MEEEYDDEYYILQAQRKAKQDYLREEILQKSYSPQDFQAYLESLKGADIDIWTIEELEEVVQEFQRKFHQIDEEESEVIEPSQEPRSDSANSQGPEISAVEVQEEINRMSIGQVRADMISAQDITSEEYYITTAFSLPSTPLSEVGPINIEVPSARIIKGGTFSRDYVLYNIKSYPFDWSVERRYSEMIKLRKILETAYPGCLLPISLPKKSGKRLQDKQITTRQCFISHFFNQIMLNPILRRSVFLVEFLQEADRKKFENSLKRFMKVKKIENMTNVPSIEGHIVCNPSIEEEYRQNINNYLTTTEYLKRRLKRQSDQIISSFAQLSQNIKEFCSLLTQLGELQVTIPNLTHTQEMYAALSQSFQDWSSFESEKMQSFKNFCSQHFKLGHMDTVSMRDMLKDTEVHLQQYQKSHARLNLKKEKLWAAGDHTKWGISGSGIDPNMLKSNKQLAIDKMLPKDSKEVALAKDKFAYRNYQTRVEIERSLKDASLLDIHNYLKFIRIIQEGSSKYQGIWDGLFDRLSHYHRNFIEEHPYIAPITV